MKSSDSFYISKAVQNGSDITECNVCAVVPLYNECQYAMSTINSLLKVKTIDAVVAVDDGSKDNTWEIINSIEGITAVRHYKNLGKARAVLDGIRSRTAKVYVFVDGDLGQSAANIGPIIDEVLNDRCDICIADFRERKGTGGFGILKGFSKFAVRFITGNDFPCPLSGIRAVKHVVIDDDRVKLYKGYGMEVGMLIDAMLAGYRINCIYVDLEHRFTYMNFKGCIHRARQFVDVFEVFMRKFWGW